MRLLAFTAPLRPAWQRHLAYIALGFAIWLGMVEEPGRPSGRTVSAIGAGAALTLLILLVLAGPVVSALTPVWRALGHVPGPVIFGAITSLVTWRAHARGRRYCQLVG